MNTVSINRAPVLTLWATVVAERLGFDENEALSLGKAVAGLNAQAKGRKLGIFKPHEEKPKEARKKERGERFLIEICGRPVPVKNTEEGIRAASGSGQKSCKKFEETVCWRLSPASVEEVLPCVAGNLAL